MHWTKETVYNKIRGIFKNLEQNLNELKSRLFSMAFYMSCFRNAIAVLSIVSQILIGKTKWSGGMEERS